MSNNQSTPSTFETRASAFTIESGSIGLAHVVAYLLQQHGLRDHPDALILIILDSPHRFALNTLASLKSAGRRCCSQQ